MYYIYLDENNYIQNIVYSTTNISKENTIKIDEETYTKEIIPLLNTYEKVKYENNKFVGINKKPEIYNYEPNINVRTLYSNYERNVLNLVSNIIESIRTDIDKKQILEEIKTHLPNDNLSYLDKYTNDKELYTYILTLSIQYHIYDIIINNASYDHENISKQLKRKLSEILDINVGG